MLHMTLAVVPPSTESVVFSIDGSFAASVSVTGKDPKVKFIKLFETFNPPEAKRAKRNGGEFINFV